MLPKGACCCSPHISNPFCACKEYLFPFFFLLLFLYLEDPRSTAELDLDFRWQDACAGLHRSKSVAHGYCIINSLSLGAKQKDNWETFTSC